HRPGSDDGRGDPTRARLAARLDRAPARRTVAEAPSRVAPRLRGRGAHRRARARDDGARGGGAGARRHVRAGADPRPAPAVGLVLRARPPLVQLAARARTARGARLRRRPRALPSARAEPLGPFLAARRLASPRVARAARLVDDERAGAACVPPRGLAP